MPLIVLTAAAIAEIIMFIRQFELYRMLWILFIVLVIFYIIGDVVQYIYMRIKPRIIPEADDIERLISKVDMSKLQLDEDVLQQYLNDNEDNPEITEDIMANAEKLNFDGPDYFEGTDTEYQDDMFMDESQGNY